MLLAQKNNFAILYHIFRGPEHSFYPIKDKAALQRIWMVCAVSSIHVCKTQPSSQNLSLPFSFSPTPVAQPWCALPDAFPQGWPLPPCALTVPSPWARKGAA